MTGLAIGDIAGKGIAAALLMAGLQASLRGLNASWSFRFKRANGKTQHAHLRCNSKKQIRNIFLWCFLILKTAPSATVLQVITRCFFIEKRGMRRSG